MLCSCRDNGIACSLVAAHVALYGSIGALCCTGREEYLFRLCTQESCSLPPDALVYFYCPVSKLMKSTGVS